MALLLKDFVHMAEVYGEDVEVYVDVPNGSIEDTIGFKKTDVHGHDGLLVQLSEKIKFKDD